jgi:antitoxin component of MazEF toxin-antitoxin module
MAQKIIKIGSSAGLTISPDMLETLGMKVGDSVEISAHPSTRAMTVRPQEKGARSVNPDVITWTNAFIDKNRKLLVRLAGK